MGYTYGDLIGGLIEAEDIVRYRKSLLDESDKLSRRRYDRALKALETALREARVARDNEEVK